MYFYLMFKWKQFSGNHQIFEVAATIAPAVTSLKNLAKFIYLGMSVTNQN
jgi:hypothetical protein